MSGVLGATRPAVGLCARAGLGTPGPDYVRLAVGRDFADVSPLRGVLQGGANHTLTVRVTVAPVSV